MYMYTTVLAVGTVRFVFKGVLQIRNKWKYYILFRLFVFNNLRRDAFHDPSRKYCKQSNSMQTRAQCVSFCTRHFVMVPLNLTYQHCIQHPATCVLQPYLCLTAGQGKWPTCKITYKAVCILLRINVYLPKSKNNFSTCLQLQIQWISLV